MNNLKYIPTAQDAGIRQLQEAPSDDFPQDLDANGGLMKENIPGIDQLHIPAGMSKAIRLEIARNLKALQKELTKGGAPDRSKVYHNLDGLTKSEKEARKRYQNQAAAKRNRMKKLRMVWGLVSSIQDLHHQVGQKTAVISNLQQENAALRQELGRGPATKIAQPGAPALQPAVPQPGAPPLPPAPVLPGFKPDSSPPVKPGANQWRPASVSLDFANQMANMIPPAIKASFNEGKIGVVELIDSLDEIMQMSTSMDSMQPAFSQNPHMLLPHIQEQVLRQLSGQAPAPVNTFAQAPDASLNLAFPELSSDSQSPQPGQYFNFGQ